MIRSRQALFIDADDTLWQNNVLFERVFGLFAEWLAHPILTSDQLREVLFAIDAANIARGGGYGAAAFVHCLGECVAKVRDTPASEAELLQIQQLAAPLLRRDTVELLRDVAETLTVLGTRNDLFLLTKGDPAEQRTNLEASGLAGHFRDVHIVQEKTPDTYRRLLTEGRRSPADTWMIGNSPRSDIIPARKAGMGAVHIPNPNLWAHERATIDPDDTGILRLARFAELTDHF
jgi:putative hydrolase of the HAD superfamily